MKRATILKPKVKRLPSPYILFAQLVRQVLKTKLLNLTFAQMGKLIATLWMQATDEFKNAINNYKSHLVTNNINNLSYEQHNNNLIKNPIIENYLNTISTMSNEQLTNIINTNVQDV
jgi:hypothetical protein